jgi:histone H3/H4
LVVKAAVKGLLKKYRVSGDFFPALDKCIEEIVKAAAKRAEANGRKTVRACDL